MTRSLIARQYCQGRGRFGLRGGTDRARVEGVQKAIKVAGCTVEDSDIMAKGDGYKADDVECKDGQYDVSLDKELVDHRQGERGLDGSSIFPLPGRRRALRNHRGARALRQVRRQDR